ncbi:TPA: hypothetical protein ACJIXE_000514 [Serratia marcescens]|uniref:hypothetical protein n=1 Tax=Serratia TaxID=613 RepID=UPI0038622604
MSVKSQFLKKLQSRHPTSAASNNKSQIDIATFRWGMEQLQAQMDTWLMETGLNAQTLTASMMDLLVEGGAFEIPAIVLHYEDRVIKFMPIFLYGQGVMGCVEATLHTGKSVIALGRLFMRAGHVSDWTFTPPGSLSHAGDVFDEETFYHLIAGLLP